MALTFIGSAHGSIGTTGAATCDTVSTLDIQAGDLLVACISWRSTTTPEYVTIAQTDGVNSLAQVAEPNTAGGRSLVLHHSLSATAATGARFRLTLAGSRTYVAFSVFQFRPGSGETPQVETAISYNAGSGTALATNAINTSKAAAVFAWYQLGATATPSNEAIGGQPADVYFQALRGDQWYEPFATAQTGITGTATLSASVAYSGAIVAYSVASSGGVTVEPNNLVTGSPVLGQPSITSAANVTPGSLITGAPILGNPDITSGGGAISPNPLLTWAPILGQPSLTLAITISPQNIVTGSPILGSPTIITGGEYPGETIYGEAQITQSIYGGQSISTGIGQEAAITLELASTRTATIILEGASTV